MMKCRTVEAAIEAVVVPRGGGTQQIHIRGGQSKKFSGNPKISFQLHCNPKISPHLMLRNQ